VWSRPHLYTTVTLYTSRRLRRERPQAAPGAVKVPVDTKPFRIPECLVYYGLN
jgi:hypothetical protein